VVRVQEPFGGHRVHCPTSRTWPARGISDRHRAGHARWMAYLRELLEGVTGARRLGLSALATVETVPLPRGHGFPRWHP
jgi:hypothetical protein